MAGTTPQETDRLVGEALARKDLDAVLELFEPDAVLVDPDSGTPLRGHTEIREGVAAMLDGGAELLDAGAPTVLVSGDVALVLSTWAMRATGPDGEPQRVSGTATDVMRRGADGGWRYVIDNPAGVELAGQG